jgi:hypothetical protein
VTLLGGAAALRESGYAIDPLAFIQYQLFRGCFSRVDGMVGEAVERTEAVVGDKGQGTSVSVC